MRAGVVMRGFGGHGGRESSGDRFAGRPGRLLLAANVQSTSVANVCSTWGGFAITFSAKSTGNEGTGTDLGTTNSCVVMEGKGGQTDYTDEMWAKDQEEINRLKAECEEHMRAFRKQMDALSELERCDDEELARLKKKVHRIERACDVMTLICVPVIVVGVLRFFVV